MQDGVASMAAVPGLRFRFEQSGGVEFEKAAKELHRFFCLTRHTDEPIAMISPNIDKLWHRLIEFTETYSQFCEETFGETIHHRARTPQTAVPDEAVRNFYRLYEEWYGPLPEIWEVGAPTNMVAFGRNMVDQLSPEIAWSGWPGRR